MSARAVAAVEPGVLDPAAFPAVTAILPRWPLTVMFGLMPLWWALGVWYFAWPFLGLVLFVLMVARGRIRLPAGTSLWLGLLGIVAVNATPLGPVTAAFLF